MYKEYSLVQEEPFASFTSPPGKIGYTVEKRKIPLTGCLLTDISSRNKNIATVSIENISPEGCLLNFKGKLCSYCRNTGGQLPKRQAISNNMNINLGQDLLPENHKHDEKRRVGNFNVDRRYFLTEKEQFFCKA